MDFTNIFRGYASDFLNTSNNMSFDFLGLGSLLGGIGTSIASAVSSNKQIKFQREENQKNRDFNAEQADIARQFSTAEAQKARDYNTEMVNAQNSYNSPSAMMSRLQSAGLNPNLVYGDLSSGPSIGVGSTGMQASSPSAATAAGTVGTSLPSFTNALKDMAETKLLEAQARQTDTQAELNEIEAKYKPQLLEGNIALTGINIEVGKSVKYLNEAKQNEACRNAALTDQKIKQVQSDVRLTNELITEKKLSNLFTRQTFKNAVQKFMDECDMTHEQAKSFATVLGLSIINQKLNNAELTNKIKVAYEQWRGLIADNKIKSWQNVVVKLNAETAQLGINAVNAGSRFVNGAINGVGSVLDWIQDWLER